MRARLGLSSRLCGAAAVAWVLLGCGSSHHVSSHSRTPTTTVATVSPRPRPRPRRRRAGAITILPAAQRSGLFGWTPAAAVGGRTAVWISRVNAYHESGFTITLLRFDQQLVRLALNPGATQPGGTGWLYGDRIGRRERRVVLAAFNSAFQEGYGAGGFAEGGRVGWRLRRGVASVVIYRDGFADIGRWRVTVPAPGRAVEAVRQNLGLLISGGGIASNVDTCIKICWGDPLHEQPIVARSALGILPGGDLVFAAGHDLSVRALAEALAGKGVVRAMELDINPRWVAVYLYAHPRHRPLTPIPLMPGQTGIPGEFLTPYFRDFFSVIARR